MRTIEVTKLRTDSKMFPFVTKTLNPLGGPCPYNCVYCWAKALIRRHQFEKYRGDPRIIEKELAKPFCPFDIIFVQDMSDLMASTVKTRHILTILDWIRGNPEVWFLLLTKNPQRYVDLADEDEIPPNAILGATIETDHYHFHDPVQHGVWTHYNDYSSAPPPATRLDSMKTLRTKIGNHLFISVEPIMEFSTERDAGYPTFADHIQQIEPWAVAVGYDNYKHHLPEPTINATSTKLIAEIEGDTTVYRKSIRPAWYEAARRDVVSVQT